MKIANETATTAGWMECLDEWATDPDEESAQNPPDNCALGRPFDFPFRRRSATIAKPIDSIVASPPTHRDTCAYNETGNGGEGEGGGEVPRGLPEARTGTHLKNMEIEKGEEGGGETRGREGVGVGGPGA